MKYTGPKIKKARRLGVAVSPKSEKYLERRPNPPGQHGPSRRRRIRFLTRVYGQRCEAVGRPGLHEFLRWVRLQCAED